MDDGERRLLIFSPYFVANALYFTAQEECKGLLWAFSARNRASWKRREMGIEKRGRKIKGKLKFFPCTFSKKSNYSPLIRQQYQRIESKSWTERKTQLVQISSLIPSTYFILSSGFPFWITILSLSFFRFYSPLFLSPLSHIKFHGRRFDIDLIGFLERSFAVSRSIRVHHLCVIRPPRFEEIEIVLFPSSLLPVGGSFAYLVRKGAKEITRNFHGQRQSSRLQSLFFFPFSFQFCMQNVSIQITTFESIRDNPSHPPNNPIFMFFFYLIKANLYRVYKITFVYLFIYLLFSYDPIEYFVL